MPLYEYECDACGHRCEVIVKYSDPPLDKCPSCGGHVHKLVSSPAFQFKGTGWYVTDYAKKDHVPAGKPGGSESESSGKDKDEKGAKSDRTDKNDNAEHGGKNDTKNDKQSEKSEKSDKGSAASDSSSSAGTPSPGSTTNPSKKDS